MVTGSSPTTRPDTRMVLLGKTGVGKSASGNSILGESVFLSEQSSSSVTAVCQEHGSIVAGRTLSLVDTPGFFMTESEDVSADIKRSVALAYPGVHAFLYIVAVTTFTKQEASIVDLFKQYLGDKALRYTVVVFTYGDLLDGKPVELVMDQNASLTTLIEACRRRYCVFNNKLPPGSSEANDQVTRLLQVVDGLIRSNAGSCYTVEMLEEVQMIAEEIREETRREEERPHQEDIQRAVQEEKDRLREEKERQEKENLEMRLEKESLQREIREEKEKREKKSKQTELTANKVILPPEPDPETPVSPPMTSEGGENMKNREKAYEEGGNRQSSTAATLATREEGLIQSNMNSTGENDSLLNHGDLWGTIAKCRVFIRNPWVLLIAVVICVGIGAGIGLVVRETPGIGFSREIAALFGAMTALLIAVIAWSASIGLVDRCKQR